MGNREESTALQPWKSIDAALDGAAEAAGKMGEVLPEPGIELTDGEGEDPVYHPERNRLVIDRNWEEADIENPLVETLYNRVARRPHARLKEQFRTARGDLIDDYLALPDEPVRAMIRFQSVSSSAQMKLTGEGGHIGADWDLFAELVNNETDRTYGQVRQLVFHHLLHQERLHAKSQYADTGNVKLIGTDTVDTVDSDPQQGGESLFAEGAAGYIAQLEEELGTDLDIAPARVNWGPVPAYELDVDDWTVTINPALLEDYNVALFRHDAKLFQRALIDAALQESLTGHIEEVSDRYATHDPEIDIKTAYFDDLKTTTNGKHKALEESGDTVRARIRLNRQKFLKDFDPEERVFRRKKPDHVALHEVVHALDFQNGTQTMQYWNARENNDLEYAKDIQHAAIEAITTFEQYLNGDTGARASAEEAYDDPWKLPEFFDGYLDIRGERDNTTIRCPYNFGLFTALCMRDAFQDTYGEEDGVERARDVLLNTKFPPEGMQTVLENSFEHQEPLNYPRRLREYDTELSTSPFPYLATDIQAEALLEAYDWDTNRPDVDAYLDGIALCAAYRAQDIDREPPKHLRWIGRFALEMAPDYIDTGIDD